MNSIWPIAVMSLVIIIVAPVSLSYVVEVFRSTPATPTRLSWLILDLASSKGESSEVIKRSA